MQDRLYRRVDALASAAESMGTLGDRMGSLDSDDLALGEDYLKHCIMIMLCGLEGACTLGDGMGGSALSNDLVLGEDYLTHYST